jgi:hypothetical protein
MTSPPSIASTTVPKTDHGIVIGAGHTEAPHHDEDDRSSSLSEIGERAEHDEADNAFYNGSDENDTEAETERLDNSPQNLRNHKAIILTSSDALYGVRSGPLETSVIPLMVADCGKDTTMLSSSAQLTNSTGSRLNTDTMEQTSEISSLADSGEETSKRFSLSPSTARKRKRSSFEQDSPSDRSRLSEPTAKATRLSRDAPSGALVGNPSPNESAREYDHKVVNDTSALAKERIQSQESPEPALTLQRYPRGKRKGRKIRDDELENKDSGSVSEVGPAKQSEGQEAVYSNEEDCENDDTGDAPGADSSVKNEEGGKSIFNTKSPRR